MVRVKVFPENIQFSGNAIFRKGKCFHVFDCISKKNFEKYFLVFGKEEGRDKTQKKKNHQIRSNPVTFSHSFSVAKQICYIIPQSRNTNKT